MMCKFYPRSIPATSAELPYDCYEGPVATHFSAVLTAHALRLATVLTFVAMAVTACSPDFQQGRSRSDSEARNASVTPKPRAKSPAGSTEAVERAAPAKEPAAAHNSTATERGRRALDLSPPRIVVDQKLLSGPADSKPVNLFDGEKLFNGDQKPGNVSLKLRPILGLGEGQAGSPSLDGGAVDFKIKTK